MLTKFIENTIYLNIANTILLTIIFLIIYMTISLIIKYKTAQEKKKIKYHARTFYTMLFIYFFFITKIWVEGFSHLFTILGLVGAALVVTNKETIMNFVGWFVISWRSLFTEDDYIEVQNKKGYVVKIGPLYFTLTDKKKNGTLTRIPNGLVLANPIINFSQKEITHLISFEFRLKGEPSYLDKIKQMRVIIEEELQTYINQYQGKSKLIKNLKDTIKIHTKPDPETVEYLRCYIHFESLFLDHNLLESNVGNRLTYLLFA